jgi:uncharacterized membrane protein YqiK
MLEWWNGFAAGAAAGTLLPIATALGLKACWERVDPATVLLVQDARGRSVSLRPRLVWPTAEVRRLSIHPHTLEVALQEDRAVWTRDRARVEVVARTTLRIDRDPEKILAVVDWLGYERAMDAKVMNDIFGPQLEEALHAVASTFSSEDIYLRRSDFKDRVLELLAPHLRGFVIDELAISTFQKIAV